MSSLVARAAVVLTPRRLVHFSVAAIALAGALSLALGGSASESLGTVDVALPRGASTPVDAGGVDTSIPVFPDFAGPVAPGFTPAPLSGPADPSTPSSPSSPSTPSSVPTGDDGVAVIGGVLRISRFGSSIGLPLICATASGSLSREIPDPNLAQVIAQTVASCAQFGAQGSRAAAALDEALRPLAVLNPAAEELLTLLQGALRTTADGQPPFATSLRELITVLEFFRS
jgi:hypothetical protein